MKLPIVCSKCMAEDIVTARPMEVVTFNDDGIYEALCPKGHTSFTILQQQKFEVLFEIGAYAIVDGYYREAVSSFTSSVERFYEFFIRALLLEKGLDEKVINESWKQIANQSERQYGAFIFLYTTEFGKSPRLPNEKNTKFRNDVIHKGKIPTLEEAVDYGQALLDVVRPILRDVKEKYPKGVEKTIELHLAHCQEKVGEKPISTMGISTIISLYLNDSGHDDRSLEKALQELWRWNLG
jgi:hypothetical protein